MSRLSAYSEGVDLGHAKTCQSIKNRKLEICTKPTLSSIYIVFTEYVTRLPIWNFNLVASMSFLVSYVNEPKISEQESKVFAN